MDCAYDYRYAHTHKPHQLYYHLVFVRSISKNAPKLQRATEGAGY